MNAVHICSMDILLYPRGACQPEDDVMCLVTLSIFVGIAYVVSLQVRTLCQGRFLISSLPIFKVGYNHFGLLAGAQ